MSLKNVLVLLLIGTLAAGKIARAMRSRTLPTVRRATTQVVNATPKSSWWSRLKSTPSTPSKASLYSPSVRAYQPTPQQGYFSSWLKKPSTNKWITAGTITGAGAAGGAGYYYAQRSPLLAQTKTVHTWSPDWLITERMQNLLEMFPQLQNYALDLSFFENILRKALLNSQTITSLIDAYTALITTLKEKDPQLAQHVLKAYQNELVQAAVNADAIDFILELINQGASNALIYGSINGYSLQMPLLHYAIATNNPPLVRHLLNKRADIYKLNRKNQNAMQMASMMNNTFKDKIDKQKAHQEITQLLQSHIQNDMKKQQKDDFRKFSSFNVIP